MAAFIRVCDCVVRRNFRTVAACRTIVIDDRGIFSIRVGAAAAILLTLSQRFLLHTRFAQEANLSTLLTLVGVTEEGELLPEKIDVIDREIWPDGKREYILFRRNN